jgi:hypothetical protein
MFSENNFLNSKINEIMETFDFEMVHRVMKFLDWEWHSSGVPSIETLKDQARELLQEADRGCPLATGGFVAEFDGMDYKLLFYVDRQCTVSNDIL